VRAKAIGYQLGWHDALPRLAPAIAESPSLVEWGIASALALVASLLLLFRPAIEPTPRASLVAGILIAAAYVLPRGFIFEWYVPLYLVPVLWPLAAMLVRERGGAAGPIARRAVAFAALAVLVLPSWLPLRAFAEGAWMNPALSPLFAQGARARQYIEVARELARRYPEATLLSSEVGGLGEGFPGRIEDGFGLVSPAALRFHPMRVPSERSSGTLGAIPPAFVAQVRPGLIVSYDVFAEALARSPVVDGYVKTAQPLFTDADAQTAAQVGVPRQLWGHRMMLDTWVRRDLAAAAGLPFSDRPVAGGSKP